MLSEEEIKEFKQLYEQKFKERLDDKEAFSRANNLLNLYKVIFGLSIDKKMDDKKMSKEN